MQYQDTPRLRRAFRAGGVAALLLAGAAAGAQTPLRFEAAQPIDDEPLGSFFTLPLSVDLDDDGDQDWIYTVGNYFAVRWLENQGLEYARRDITSFGAVIPMGRTPQVADFDKDGDLDVLVSGKKANNSALAELSWLDQPTDPVGGFWKKRAIVAGEESGVTLVENLNGDIRLDMVSLFGPLKYRLNSASGPVEFSAPISVPIDGSSDVVRTDLDGDGLVDLLLDASSTLRRVEIEPGTPPVFTETDLGFPGRFYQAFTFGDLTGDDRPDAVYGIQNSVLGAAYLDLYMRPNEFPGGTFGEEVKLVRLPVTSFDFEDIEIRDLDSDGRNDLFIQQRGGHIYVMPNSGGENPFVRLIVPDSPALPSFEGLGLIDFDRDGDLDLAREGARLEWYPNDSSAYIRKATLTQDFDEGFYTPGETGSLLVNLGNFAPRAVGNVSFDLSSSSPDFIPDTVTGDIGAIAIGGSRDLAIPFQISPSALCGSTLDVIVDVKVAGTTVDRYTIPIVLGELTDVETIAGASETPNAAIPEPVIIIPIPDPVAVPLTRTLTVTIPPGPIVSVELDLNITHSYRGDLVVQLRSPEGTARTVFEGTVNDSGTSVTGPFTVFGFEGEQAAGQYALLVSDRVQGDVGTLVSWGLTVSGTTQNCDIPAGLPAVAESILAIAEPQPSDDVNEDGILDCADLIAAN